MHKDLLEGYASNIAKLVEVSQNKVKGITTYFHRLNLAINSCILLTLLGKLESERDREEEGEKSKC